MRTSELAAGLGISVQMCNRLKKRGMPCDSLQSAIEWRKRNLDITQTKSWRIDGNQGMKTVSVETTKETCTLKELQAVVNNSKQLDLKTTDADELYRNARALKEKALALQAVAGHKQFIGSLVEKSVVEKIIFERGRQFRDGVIACSRRIAPDVIGKESITEIESIIQKELRVMLEQFARLPAIQD
ncbi:hypothetical protein HS096_05065 [candidate division WWE3 bacterium]|uniref:Uncharacterized protein n=1 Tax=candidate division WWE3 bacterium TaxID=2053526 RepID=A0A928TWL5_UNCKA|nr:hypothetical protein [candidate division WWE3 bacterium]